jgi:SNF2 family DNA or RNA helicase
VALGRARAQDRFRAIEWDVVIVDEAHVLKNDKAKLHVAMKMVRDDCFGC